MSKYGTTTACIRPAILYPYVRLRESTLWNFWGNSTVARAVNQISDTRALQIICVLHCKHTNQQVLGLQLQEANGTAKFSGVANNLLKDTQSPIGSRNT